MIIKKSTYQNLIDTIRFQETQIEHLAKQLKEAKRRAPDGRFISNKEIGDDVNY